EARPQSGARGAVRPDGGVALPPHRAVRTLAPGSGCALLHLRATRGAGRLRPGHGSGLALLRSGCGCRCELSPLLDRDANPAAVFADALEHDHGLSRVAPERKPTVHRLSGTFGAVRDLHALTVRRPTDIAGIAAASQFFFARLGCTRGGSPGIFG